MKNQLDPTSLTIEDLARVLKASGSTRATVEVLRADLDVGAPANADGTVNLVHYAAWLVKEMGHGRD